MAGIDKPSVVAIVPCNDLDGAQAWWNRLGFRQAGGHGHGDYRVLSDQAGACVHLTQAVPGWVRPGRNPFGVYIYTPRVDELAQVAKDAAIGPSARPVHTPWGMYEIALNGPDDLLVRIGWPSRLLLGDAGSAIPA